MFQKIVKVYVIIFLSSLALGTGIMIIKNNADEIDAFPNKFMPTFVPSKKVSKSFQILDIPMTMIYRFDENGRGMILMSNIGEEPKEVVPFDYSKKINEEITLINFSVDNMPVSEYWIQYGDSVKVHLQYGTKMRLIE